MSNLTWKIESVGKARQIARAEVQLGTIVRMIDLGIQTTEYQGEKRCVRKMQVSFELPDDVMESGEFKGKPLLISNTYTVSMDKRANLRNRLVEPLVGKFASDKEAMDFDVLSLLGKSAMLTISHRKNHQGIDYAVVNGIMQVHKSMKAPEPVHELLVLKLSNFDEEVYNKLPTFTKEKINLSEVDSKLLTTNTKNDLAANI